MNIQCQRVVEKGCAPCGRARAVSYLNLPLLMSIAMTMVFLGICSMPIRAAQKADTGSRSAPVAFIYADLPNPGTMYDIDARWNAIPVSVRPYAVLAIRMPHEFNYEIKGDADKREVLKTPQRSPEFPKENSQFLKALDRAQERGIKILLQTQIALFVEEYGVNTGSPAETARFTDLFEKYPCIYGTQSEELACYRPLNANVQNHLKTFIPLARKYNRKFIWTALLSDKYFIWNKLLTDSEMASFMKTNYDTFLPMEKSVSVDDIMLNWADCVGMWLSGYSSAWSFKFDSFYYENYIIAEKGMAERDKHQYYPSLGKNVARFYRIACPSYLLKDSMILAALTGASCFANEPTPAFDYATQGPLRPTLDKTYEFIVENKLWRSKNEILSLCKVALESPVPSEIRAQGFSHSHTKKDNSPNIVWNQVFGIPDGGHNLLPKEGKNFIVPVVPHQGGTQQSFPVTLKPEQINTGHALSLALASGYPRHFVASDSNVLVFDAGKYVYITDSRVINRTDLEFSLESLVDYECKFLFLTQDATALKNIEPVKENIGKGWRIKILLPAGCSILLTKK
jgi:hypothetical protein